MRISRIYSQLLRNLSSYSEGVKNTRIGLILTVVLTDKGELSAEATVLYLLDQVEDKLTMDNASVRMANIL